jgi:pyruvate formate lyase activating enzyme
LLALDRRPGELIAEDQILGSIEARATFLDGVVISGGEPTIQKDLAAFIGRIRAMGLKIKLDTNGSRPAVLGELLASGLLDSVAMDIKAPWSKYPQLTGGATAAEAVRESLCLLAESDTPCRFRTTFVPSLLSQQDLDEIRSYLPDRTCHTVQAFVPDKALDEALRSTTGYLPDTKDNIPLHLDWLSGE